jgi:hypothetical protein
MFLLSGVSQHGIVYSSGGVFCFFWKRSLTVGKKDPKKTGTEPPFPLFRRTDSENKLDKD